MATATSIDGLRPLSQSELASLLRTRREQSLSTAQNGNDEQVVVHVRRNENRAGATHHLDLSEQSSKDLYVRPKARNTKHKPVREMNEEIQPIELLLPHINTYMRPEVHFIGRSRKISDIQAVVVTASVLLTTVLLLFA